jgi:hypothetical protein
METLQNTCSRQQDAAPRLVPGTMRILVRKRGDLTKPEPRAVDLNLMRVHSVRFQISLTMQCLFGIASVMARRIFNISHL